MPTIAPMTSTQPGTAPSSALDGFALEVMECLAGLPGVLRAGLAVRDGGGRQLLFTASDRGGDPDGLEWCRIDATADVPLVAACLGGDLVLGDLDTLAPRFPDFVAGRRGTDVAAVAAVPLVGEGLLGGFILYLDATRPVDALASADLVDLGLAVGSRLQDLRVGRRRPGAPDHPDATVAVHEMGGNPAALAGARRFLRDTLLGWGVPEDPVDDAVLCLAELATNAVVHAHGGCRIEVQLDAGVLAVRVLDEGAIGPVRLAPTADDLTAFGRGLQIVEALASRSGRVPEECLAWFEIDLP